MAQLFGIDFSTEDVANIFSTCIACFDHTLQKAPKDEKALRLSLVRLRLTRWGKAVNIYRESGREQDTMDPDETGEVKKICLEMMTLFETLSASTQKEAIILTPNLNTNTQPRTQKILAILEAIAAERTGGKNLLSSHTLGYGSWPTSLVENTSKLITDLEDCIPAAPVQHDLCETERMRFENAGHLEYLVRVATETNDPWLSASRFYGYHVVNVDRASDVVLGNVSSQLGNSGYYK